MRKEFYAFIPVKIHRVEGTDLAISSEADDKLLSTTLKFYQVNDEEQTYKRIGLRIAPFSLYVSFKTHHKALSDIINKFMDLHPQHEHLLK